MQIVRLYGRGATTIQMGKQVIRSHDGQIDVPETLVAHFLALGWSRAPLAPDAPELFHALDVPDVAAIEVGAPIGAHIVLGVE